MWSFDKMREDKRIREDSPLFSDEYNIKEIRGKNLKG